MTFKPAGVDENSKFATRVENRLAADFTKKISETTAARLVSARIKDLGEMFEDIDVVPPRIGYGDGVTASRLLPHAAGTRYDMGEAFVAKLDAKSGRAVLFTPGDSTNVGVYRLPSRIATRLAAMFPAALVDKYDGWDDSAKTYVKTTVQAGTPQSTAGVKTDDTFTRTVADLKGSVSDTGQTWGGASGAAGMFSTDGSKAVRTGTVANAFMLIDSGSAGDRQIDISGVTISTVGNGSGTNVVRIPIKFLDNSNLIYGALNISSSGQVSWNIVQIIANVSTTLVSGAANPIAANTAGQTTSFQLSVSGTTVTFKIGAATITATISADVAATLTPATQDGILVGPIAFSMDEYKSTITAAVPPALQIAIYNAGISGSIFSAQREQLALMCPETPDLIMPNSCHNYGSMTPAAYLTVLDQFINANLAIWPTAGVALKSPNPEIPPNPNMLAHLARYKVLSTYSRVKGIGYIPVFEGYRALSDLGVSLIRTSDLLGAHPSDPTERADAASGTAVSPTAGNGTQLEERIFFAWLASMRKTSTPTS